MKPSQRNRQLIRTWEVLKQIEHRAPTLRELAQYLEVTERTIRRDIEALDLAGFPLYNERNALDGRTRWHLARPGLVPARPERVAVVEMGGAQ